MTWLRPRDGWRAFAGEVGVIVLGVLLALGAQQAVESWQIRRDVVAFRETIDREVSYNLYALDMRDRQVECDRRKVAELEAWLVRSRNGASMPPIYPYGPHTSSPYWGAWNSRDAETYRQLPAEVRQKYAMFYDGLANYITSSLRQIDAWSELRQFGEPGPLTITDRRTVRMRIERLKRSIAIDHENIGYERKAAGQLGIRAIEPQDIGKEALAEGLRCRSILVPPKT